MNDSALNAMCKCIQVDIGNRGLAADPKQNLFNAYLDDFQRGCVALAKHPQPHLAIVTGFYIPTATPPAGETDGPLGALFLARALTPLGIAVTILTDEFCINALRAGLDATDLTRRVTLITLPTPQRAATMSDAEYWQSTVDQLGTRAVTHLLAMERVGPSHADGLCRTMRGRDITDHMSPVHRLFEDGAARANHILTIGIGDGGNEIGMGKIRRNVIEANIPNGHAIACRVPTDLLIVSGISNWGAYGLAAGVSLLRGSVPDPSLFDAAREQEILQAMVEAGPLVDGVTGQPTATVDGTSWNAYADVLRLLRDCVQ